MPYDSAIIAETASFVEPSGTGTTPEVTACSADPIAADMVCEPARSPPAAPVGRSNILAPATTRPSPRKLHTTARTVYFKPSPFRLLRNDGPTLSPTPYMNR